MSDRQLHGYHKVNHAPRSPAEYFGPDNWLGWYFELAIDLGPRNDERLRRATDAIWGTPGIRGPLPSPFSPPEHRPRSRDRHFISVHGELSIGEFPPIGCLTVVVPDVHDWLDLSIPEAMLRRRFPISEPLRAATNPWARAVENLFVSAAERVFRVAPFELAFIGEEVSGGFAAVPRPLTTATIEHYGGVLLSPSAWERLERPDAVALTSGLRWVRWKETIWQ